MASILRLLLIVLLSFSGSSVFSQNTNSFVGIRFGAALPLGEFASHEIGYGGYALLGKSFGGEAAWFFSPEFGVGIDVSRNSFEFASGYYAEDFYQQNKQDYIHVSLLSGPYTLTTFMAGGYYKLAWDKRFSSSFKLMGGLFRARTPDQFFGIKTYKAGNLNWSKSGARDTKFTLLAGVSTEYRLYPQVSLVLQADFTFSRPAFTFITGETSSYTDYLYMPVFRLQPGINIHF